MRAKSHFIEIILFFDNFGQKNEVNKNVDVSITINLSSNDEQKICCSKHIDNGSAGEKIPPQYCQG